jgi:hypothetical protein
MGYGEADPEAKAFLSEFTQGLSELGWTDGASLAGNVCSSASSSSSSRWVNAAEDALCGFFSAGMSQRPSSSFNSFQSILYT